VAVLLLLWGFSVDFVSRLRVFAGDLLIFQKGQVPWVVARGCPIPSAVCRAVGNWVRWVSLPTGYEGLWDNFEDVW